MDRETVLRMVEAGDREDFRQAFAVGGAPSGVEGIEPEQVFLIKVSRPAPGFILPVPQMDFPQFGYGMQR